MKLDFGIWFIPSSIGALCFSHPMIQFYLIVHPRVDARLGMYIDERKCAHAFVNMLFIEKIDNEYYVLLCLIVVHAV